MKLHIHWHKFVTTRGVNHYYECRCGHRKVIQPRGGGMSPISRSWLEGGDWTKPPTAFRKPKR